MLANPRPAIPPVIGRAQLQKTPTGLRVVIPAKWSWYTFIVEPALAAIIFATPRTRLLLESKATASILGVLLLVTVVRRWLWNTGGKEMVVLSEGALTVRYEVFGLSWQWSYKLNGISNFRFAAPVDAYRVHEHRTVAFDYEFLPRRFGTYLSEAEVCQLIAVIQTYVGSGQSALKAPETLSVASSV